MPRILGVDLPQDKPTHISLRYIFGIGPTLALDICRKAGVDPQRRARELTDDDISRIATSWTRTTPWRALCGGAEAPLPWHAGCSASNRRASHVASADFYFSDYDAAGDPAQQVPGVDHGRQVPPAAGPALVRGPAQQRRAELEAVHGGAADLQHGAVRLRLRRAVAAAVDAAERPGQGHAGALAHLSHGGVVH